MSLKRTPTSLIPPPSVYLSLSHTHALAHTHTRTCTHTHTHTHTHTRIDKVRADRLTICRSVYFGYFHCCLFLWLFTVAVWRKQDTSPMITGLARYISQSQCWPQRPCRPLTLSLSLRLFLSLTLCLFRSLSLSLSLSLS